MAKDFSLRDSIKKRKTSKGIIMKNIETKYILKSLLAQLANIDTLKKKKKNNNNNNVHVRPTGRVLLWMHPNGRCQLKSSPTHFLFIKKKQKLKYLQIKYILSNKYLIKFAYKLVSNNGYKFFLNFLIRHKFCQFYY